MTLLAQAIEVTCRRPPLPPVLNVLVVAVMGIGVVILFVLLLALLFDPLIGLRATFKKRNP